MTLHGFLGFFVQMDWFGATCRVGGVLRSKDLDLGSAQHQLRQIVLRSFKLSTVFSTCNFDLFRRSSFLVSIEYGRDTLPCRSSLEIMETTHFPEQMEMMPFVAGVAMILFQAGEEMILSGRGSKSIALSEPQALGISKWLGWLDLPRGCNISNNHRS